MKFPFLCPLALLLCAGVPLSHAADPGPLPPTGPLPFSVYDLDGDGSITGQEFNTIRNRRLTVRGQVGRPLARSPQFNEFDIDGDGVVTPGELEQAQREMGLLPDVGTDVGAGQAMGPATGAGPGMGAGKGAGKGAGMRPGANMPTFAEFDTDGDGAISEQEYVDGRNRRIAERAAAGYPMRGLSQAADFSAVDSDGNGSLSPEEFAAQQAGHGPGR